MTLVLLVILLLQVNTCPDISLTFSVTIQQISPLSTLYALLIVVSIVNADTLACSNFDISAVSSLAAASEDISGDQADLCRSAPYRAERLHVVTRLHVGMGGRSVIWRLR